MSERDRLASHGGAVLAPPPPAARPPAAMPPPDWEDRLLAAPPARQRELRQLAARQGGLTDEQMPPPTPPGHWSHALDHPAELPPLPLDAEGDAVSRAVRLALRTPDVAAIRAARPQRDAAVVALVRAALADGLRVVVVDAPAGLQAVNAAADDPNALAVRLLGEGETLSELSHAARALTPVEQARRLRDMPGQLAAQEVAALRQRLDRTMADGETLNELRPLLAERDRLAALLAAPEHEPVGAKLSERAGPLRERLDELDCDCQAARSALAAFDSRAQLRASKQFWTAAWWRERFAAEGDPGDGRTATLALLDDREREREQLRISLADCEAERDRLEELRVRAAERRRLDQQRHDETAHRCAELLAKLSPDCGNLTDPLAAAAAQRDTLARLSRALDQAQQWRAMLPDLLDGWDQRWAEEANLVFAPIGTDPADAGLPLRLPFDLLVLPDADALPDATGLQPWAYRCAAFGNGAGLFGRLRDALSGPAWFRDGERLGARLLNLTEAERSRLHREPLADNPGIELAIHAPAHRPAALAEVRFSGDCTTSARRFLATQADQPLLQPRAAATWRDDDAGWLAAFGEQPTGEWLELLDGVDERIDPATLTTLAVRFHARAGWTRERAERWVGDRLARHPGRCLDMTAPIPDTVPHPINPPHGPDAGP